MKSVPKIGRMPVVLLLAVVAVGVLALFMSVVPAGQAMADKDPIVPVGKDGVVHSCVNTHSGELKIVNAGDDCKNGWTALNWNVGGKGR
jgi:hypothetical protein